MKTEDLCSAIRDRRVVRFHYSNGKTPGERTVEPHVVAVNTQQKMILSGWFRDGASSSRGSGWREYFVDDITELDVLSETFEGPRVGYNPHGRMFSRILEAL